LADHKSFISPFNILFNKLNNDFSCLYWIPELHKNPYRENNNAGAYSFQENILTAVKGEYNRTGSKPIHVVVLIKCGYWTTESSA
jgi:hypothetical protein